MDRGWVPALLGQTGRWALRRYSPRPVSDRERRQIDSVKYGPRHAALLEELRRLRYAIEAHAHSTSAGLCDVTDMLRCLIEQRGADQ